MKQLAQNRVFGFVSQSRCLQSRIVNVTSSCVWCKNVQGILQRRQFRRSTQMVKSARRDILIQMIPREQHPRSFVLTRVSCMSERLC